MSWSNSYSQNYSNQSDKKHVYKIIDDNENLFVHHIVASNEFNSFSVEELRLKSKRESATGYNRGYSNYGQGSVTPDKYSFTRGDSFGSTQGANTGLAYNSNTYNPTGINTGYSTGFNSNTTLSSNINNQFALNTATNNPFNANLTQNNPLNTQNNPFGSFGQENRPNNVAGGLNNANYGYGNKVSQSNPFASSGNTYGTQNMGGGGFGNGQNLNNTNSGFINYTQTTGNGFGGQIGNNLSNNPFFVQTSAVPNTNPNMFTSNQVNSIGSFPNHFSSSHPYPSSFPTNYSSSNPYASFTQSSNFFSQPQNTMHSTNSLQFSAPDYNSQHFSQRPMQLSSFFKDPYGLSYIFPGKDPEELLKNYKVKDPGPISVSVTQRILGSKSSLKFTDKKDPTYIVKPKVFKRPKKTGLFNFPVKEKFKEIQYDYIEDNGVKFFKNVEKSPPKIDFMVEIKGDERYNIDLSVYPGNIIAEIKENIVKNLNNTQEFILKLRDKTLQPYETVAEAGIRSGDILVIEYIDDSWPTLEMLPQSRLLKIFPPIEQMAKMSIVELKNIENLTLENENGKIVFEGKTDVLGIDFDKFLKLEPKSFQGFPESDGGQRFNKPALIHLYNIKPGKNPGKMEVHLRISCEQQGTEFIKYDPIQEEFIFKVFHL